MNDHSFITLVASTVNGITARFVTDIGYEKETFVWEDGETDDKILEIPTSHVDGTTYPRSFRLKLSAQTVGDHANCVVPDIPNAKVIIGLVEEE